MVYTAIAVGSFSLAYFAKTWHGRTVGLAQSVPPSSAPDSVRLSDMGINPGRQLVVYVLLSSRCGQCQRLDTRTAVRSLRELIRENNASAYKSAAVVVVAVDELSEGLDYINSIGLGSFDEVSVGSSWLNEHLVRLIWRDDTVKPIVPQILVISREMTAGLTPFRVGYGTDSVLAVLTGRKRLLEWARLGGTAGSAARIAAWTPEPDTATAGIGLTSP